MLVADWAVLWCDLLGDESKVGHACKRVRKVKEWHNPPLSLATSVLSIKKALLIKKAVSPSSLNKISATRHKF